MVVLIPFKLSATMLVAFLGGGDELDVVYTNKNNIHYDFYFLKKDRLHFD